MQMKWLAAVLVVVATACGTTASGGGAAISGADSLDDVGLAGDATAVDDADASVGTDVAPGNDVIPGQDVAPGQDALSDVGTDSDAMTTDAATDAATADVAEDVKPACSAQTCDDGDPCTDDGCDAVGACVHGPKPGCGNTPVPCGQASDCTKGTCDLKLHICVACQKTADCGGLGQCINQKCVAAVACASDGQCKATNQVCDKNAAFCVDCVTAGDCKIGETCAANKCSAAPAKCASSKDCAGLLVCDKAAGICVGCVLPGDCTAAETCQANACVAKICTTPICQSSTVWNCNAEGTGYVAAPTPCDDGQPCTTDLCAPGTGCVHPANADACTDGNACTAGDTCAAGKCASGKPTDCNDLNVCTNDSCQPATGCVHLASNATACDDGSFCTSGDACQGTACVGKVTVSCDDGNACTADACDKIGCTHTAGAGACEDGNPCTVSDSCAGSLCAAGIANTCDDGNECTVDACETKTGCAHTLKAGCIPVSLPPCAIDADCTAGTVCDTSAHTCVACVKDADCGASGVCQAHTCKTAVACQSDVQCKATKQVCNTTAKACVDCNFKTDCATGEECLANQCVAVKACTSSKDCTKVCDQQKGVCADCLSDADCTTAQFCGTEHVCHADVCVGPACNGTSLWTCNANGSGYASATSCSDGILCTIDSCTVKACVHTPKFDATAFEFPGNGLDDNCDGKTDDVALCDTGLSSATPGDYSKALDLCSGTSDFTVSASAQARAIRGKFGSTFAPQAGSNMVMLSTGIAAAEGEAGYAAPEQGTNFQFTTSTNVNQGKCAGSAPHDASVLRVKVAIPANATAMAFDFALFSAEYLTAQSQPDGFSVVVQGAAYSGDVVGDALGKCFSPNNLAFTSCATCSKGATGLTGTGYETHGAYGWETASFPVKGGDTVTVEFAIFDVGDGIFDTAVLLDSLRFTNAAIATPTLVAK